MSSLAYEPMMFSGMLEAYPILARLPLVHGEETSPRGQRTRELLGVTFRLEDPIDSLPYGTGRNINTEIAAVEAIQLIGGFSKPDLVFGASSNFKRYAEDNGTFWGAYGTRIGRQVEAAVGKLARDPDTRQAVITLWDPALDNTPGKRDYPCTISFTFHIRNGRLHMHTVMRSSDVWLGISYDIFQFTQLQLTIADALDREVGWYTHTSQSLHAYERDWERITELHPGRLANVQVLGFDSPEEVTSPAMRWNTARSRALIISGQHPVGKMTKSELWYLDRIKSAYAKTEECADV